MAVVTAGWSGSEAELVAALRDRDDAAFRFLVDQYHGPLLRLALNYVPSRAVAEDVVQDTFLAVFKGIGAFEGRSSLKTWIYRILLNIARTRGVREQRSIPFASIARVVPGEEPAVGPERFLPADDRWSGHWTSFPFAWEHVPEERLLAAETMDVLRTALDRLPPAQREVLVMRDVLGMTSAEICNALSITETNQRVLLHRARAKLRAVLEEHLATESAA
jgi:RNA polymerase sigma-70 factor (ECF subfamily)